MKTFSLSESENENEFDFSLWEKQLSVLKGLKQCILDEIKEKGLNKELENGLNRTNALIDDNLRHQRKLKAIHFSILFTQSLINDL